MRRRRQLASSSSALLMLRVVLGGVMLLAGAAKMSIYRLAGFLPVPVVGEDWQIGLPTRVARWVAANPDGALGAAARDLLLPNALLVAGTIAWAQLVAGILLVVGLWTRAAAFVGGMLAVALAAVSAVRGSGEVRGYLFLGVIALAVMLGNAGLVGGLDGWRSERRRDLEL